jgi:hypothetical protein
VGGKEVRIMLAELKLTLAISISYKTVRVKISIWNSTFDFPDLVPFK